jgi:DNA-binding beta-propeller fold protein YncE
VSPLGVYVDSSGNIFVADSNNNRICKWSSTGNAIGWIGNNSVGWQTTSGTTAGNGYQSFNTPSGLYVNSSGNIFVVDSNNYRISKWAD